MLKGSKNQIRTGHSQYAKSLNSPRSFYVNRHMRMRYSDAGFAAFYITILILAVVFAISVSIYILTYGEQKISSNIIKSNQAYYTAEAGIEDALLRLVKKWNWSSPYVFNVDGATTTVEISDVIGGSRTITSTGNSLNRIRKVQAVYSISTQETSFYYGAQVGEGGIEMQDASQIQGNVFSNGSIIKLSGSPQITGTAKVAKTGNKISGMDIGKDAYVDICENSQIQDTLTSATSNQCTAATYKALTEEIATTSLPISEEQIEKWKEEATSGGVIVGDYILQGSQAASLGPKKIEGRLTVQNVAQLKVTGTLWVTGEIIIQDKAQVFLDQISYRNRSGVIVGDGRVVVQNNTRVSGSGQSGSYLMLLSTLDSLLTGEMAIVVQDSPQLDIIYASRGRIQLQNSIRLREVCGWGLKLQNKAAVIYESGLADVSFTSGPGGSWEVGSWEEVE